MCYEEFKMEMIHTLKNYLPQEFQSWHLVISTLTESNGLTDVVSLVTEHKETESPGLNVDKFYRLHQSGFDIESAIRDAAEEFLLGMGCPAHIGPAYGTEHPEENIIYGLINTEQNLHMLERLPHREILDLSVIYRLITDTSDSGFHSIVITDKMAESFGLDEEALFHLAEENTPEWMPMNVFYGGNHLYVVGNTRRRLGAATLLCGDILEGLANQLKSDLYILPASIHEIFVISVNAAELDLLREAVKSGNRTVIERDEMLSDYVYLYHRGERCLELLDD